MVRICFDKLVDIMDVFSDDDDEIIINGLFIYIRANRIEPVKYDRT